MVAAFPVLKVWPSDIQNKAENETLLCNVDVVLGESSKAFKYINTNVKTKLTFWMSLPYCLGLNENAPY